MTSELDAEALASAAASPAPEPAAPLPGSETVNGKVYMRDAKGGLIPLELVRPQDLLQDEIVRRLIGEARELSARLSKFRADCFDQVALFNELLADQYCAKSDRGKGNQTLATFDGLERLQVQVADQISFGPELQVAKTLVDECLTEWAAESGAELRSLVEHAFQVDKEGMINKGRLFSLLRLTITDPRWVRAMQAIRDSIRVVGSRQYVRFHERPTHLAGWSAVSLDIATA